MKPTDRVCILVGRMPWSPLRPGQKCEARTHSHTTAANASSMVEDGTFAWVTQEVTGPKGKVKVEKQLAIRTLRKREWKPRMSVNMMVLQLVP